MKRKLISLITAFALCLSLCPTWALAVDTATVSRIETLKEDRTATAELIVEETQIFDVRQWSYTAKTTTAIVIKKTGKLYLQGLEGGSVTSAKLIGVKVESGGSLVVEDPVVVTGKTYGLDVASGAAVELSGGTFSGGTAAIRTADGNFAALLVDGYAYFDAAGNPMLPEGVATAKTVTIKQCADHPGKTYIHNDGAPTHSWACAYCGAKTDAEPCTFSFGADGTAECAGCGHKIAIAIDTTNLGNLIYNSEEQTANVTLTVTLGDGTPLTENTDYEVSYTSRADVGEITVTVTGITYNGTFTKTYSVSQAQPVISWAETTKAVDYNGSPVKPTDLPSINITNFYENLSEHIQYSYKKEGDTDFTDGLPTNAGTYEIKASLPESQNYEAAETDPCLILTINKIPAVITAPTAKTLTYNREPQELVTAGVLEPGAVDEGAKIEFATDESGPYSTDIPTGITVSSYNVWYRVASTENYTGASELIKNPDPQHSSARINHKTITPTVELSYYTTLYDDGEKQPTVTVKDGEAVVPNTEYAVTYTNNKNVGTATVKVTNKANGNYSINQVIVNFQITPKTQDALSITKQPDTVTYGDQFTLGTSGGSGNGAVTWTITAGKDTVATVDENSGQVTIKGHGTATVQATKSGTYNGVKNYEDAIATWTLTAVKKPVTATVTAENKVYDGDPTATVHAVVEQGVLPGDEITITGLSGTFSDENAGTNITVTVTGTPSISGNHSEHYDVTLSSRSVKADITKATTNIAVPPGQITPALTYDRTAQALVTAGEANISTIPLEYALSENGPYSPDIPKGINAGSYEVWYRVPETDNYTGTAADKVSVTIQRKPVTDPGVTLTPGSFEYDGAAKEPAVTVMYTNDSGEIVTIPASEYTVAYSNNINVGTGETKPTVTVTAKADGNYDFSAAENFTITKKKAQVVTAPSPAGDPLTYNTREQALVTAGAASGGTMVYSVDNRNGTYSPTTPTAKAAKDYTVYYKVKGDDNHSDSDVGSVVVTIGPKVVKDPTIELKNADGTLIRYTYDGAAKTPVPVVKDGSTEIVDTEYDVTYVNNKDAGTATVYITDRAGGNYTVTGSTTFVIDKADIADPAPSAADLTYNGKPQELLNGSSFDGGTILYSMSQNGTYTDAIPTATNAGSYTVWYKVTGDKNHNDLAAKSVDDVTIKRKPLTTVTIELSPNAFAYDGQVHMPAVTVKDGNTVLPESEYTVNYPADPKDEGTYTITVSDAADGNYDLTGVTTTADFAIGKAPQAELVIDHKTAVTNYGESFTLTATGGSGEGAVSWEATGSAATVDAATGEVKITGLGDVTITATKAAEGNYFEAKAYWTFTAAPRPVTAAVTVKNKTYDGGVSAAIDTVTVPVLSGDTVTVEKTSLTAAFADANVGTGKKVTLDCSEAVVGGVDADKYDISYPASVRADITQATTILTAPASKAPLTYSGQPQELVTAAAANFGDVVYSLDGTNFSTAIPTGTNAGDYTVYYKVVGNANYTGAAGENPIDVAIAPKTITPTVEASPSSCVYDGSKKTPTITVKDGITVLDGDQYTVDWGNTDWTSVGTHTVTITSTGKNYTFTGTGATAEVEIRKAVQNALKITGKPGAVRYGDTIALDTTGGSGNGSVKWTLTGGTSSTIGETTGVLEIKEMGTFTVTAERTVTNYETATDTWTFTVQPKQVTAEVTVAPKVYDGKKTIAADAITAVVNASDLVNSSDDVRISGLNGYYDDVNAGTNKTVTLYDTASVGGTDAGKYSVSYPATATGTITPKAVTVTVALTDGDLKTDTDGTTKYFIYDGAAKTPAVTVTTGDGTELSSRDYDVSYSNNKNVGTATVTVTAKAGGNYTFDNAQPVTATFAIKKGAAVLTGSPQARSLTYTGGAQELVTVGTATGGAVWYSATGADNSYGPSIPKKTDAGTYTVYYMVKGDSNHTDTTPSQVSVTIHPKTVTSPVITLSQTSYVYDGTAKIPAVTEVKDGSTVIPSGEYTPVYSNNTNAGAATVTIQNNNGGNYIVNGTKTFEITKAKATFATDPSPKTLAYNGTAQPLVTAGTSQDGTVVYSLNDGAYSATIPTGTDKGVYKVLAKVQGDANHEDSDPLEEITVTIGVNNVTNPTIELSSNSFTYNGSEQKPTVTVKDDGGKVIPANEYTVVYGNDGESTINQGSYTITITSKGTNYSFAVQTRTITILPANQTALSITGKPNAVCYGDTLQLGTTGGSGNGAVTWSIEAGGDKVRTGGSVGQFEITGVGSITIKASRTAAGSNYADVEDTWEFYAYPKPVTAIVTAKDREYIEDDTTAELTVTVPGTAITVMGLTGTFDSPNVGTSKTVRIDHRDPQVTGNEAGNYEIAYPDTTTASITPKAATVAGVTKIDNLTYTGSPQALVTPGSATGGSAAYSLDGVNYSLIVPTGTDAGTYKVWYKALARENYKDSTPETEEVTIGPNTDAPTVMCVPGNVRYDGSEKTPAVIVRDSAQRVIPAKEYTVAYSDNTEVGPATVTVTDNDGGNYEFDTPAIGTFNIVEASQNPLTIVTDKPTDVCYGDSFRLSATGGSGSGAIQWSIEGTCATINNDGVVTVTGIGGFTVKAQRAADGSYSASNEDAVPFYANPKPVTPIVTAEDKNYDGKTDATLNVSWKPGDLVGADTITVDVAGEFLTEGVGTNKQVKIVVKSSAAGDVEKYVITYPATTTASIYKVNARLTTTPTEKTGLVYDGREYELLDNGGATENGIGVVEYSLSEKGEYSTEIPKATNAGAYTVWYRVADSVNYTGIAPAMKEVTIAKAKTSIDTAPTASAITFGQTLSQSTLNDGVGSVPGSFAWTNGSFKPDVGTSEQEVTFTPADAVNYEPSTTTIQVTVEAPNGDETPGDDDPGSIPSITATYTQTNPDGSTTTKTEDEQTGTVTETTNKPDGSSVTKVEQKDGTTATVTADAGGKTEAEVTLSAQAVSEAQEKGEAVALPIPKVKATKSADTAPAITVNTGSEGEVMVEIPAADVTPGTVAVIVKADGTQEVIKTSVPTENGVAVSLPDGATVKLVDNSKEFADVPAESQEADAVAFTSARELFTGTSKTTFDPDAPMTRAMMTTVLARLDGVDTTGGATWYEKGQDWAVAKGISNGSNPNGSITREQLAVMLWRYAGCPAADGEALNFADADKASEYAKEALRWATAKGILGGTGDGLLDPGGTATRAEAAQILKNFIENT